MLGDIAISSPTVMARTKASSGSLSKLKKACFNRSARLLAILTPYSAKLKGCRIRGRYRGAYNDSSARIVTLLSAIGGLFQAFRFDAR